MKLSDFNKLTNAERTATFLTTWQNRKEQLISMYEDQGLSQTAIANHYETHLRTIQRAFLLLGIKQKSKGRRGKGHFGYKDGKSSVLYRTKITKDKCEKCETMENLGIHHKDFDHYNDDPKNLQVLCVHCHLSLHKKEWWKAKKAGLPTPKGNGRVGWSPES